MALAARTSMALRSPSVASCRSARRSCVVVRAESQLPPVPQSGKQWMMAQPGVCAPTGFFDPAGFTSAPTFSVGEAKRFRESEVTHGRVAMLAALGWVVQEEFHPLFGGNIGGPAFVHFQKVEGVFPQFWELILLAIGITEAYRIGIAYNNPNDKSGEQLKKEHYPGELGFDPLGIYPTEPSAKFDIQTKELNNGRLAMIAIAGFAAQEERDHMTIWRGVFGGVDPAPPAAFPPY